jgi:DNA repair protein RecO (recombination protein O)
VSRLAKTSAIVVRHVPHSESSRIVHWITRDHGKLSTLAKGAQRPRNDFLGQIDNLYTCELVYYAQDRDMVFIAKEISAQKVRARFRSDWRAATAGLYMADLVARVIPHHEPSPLLFDLLEETLDEFSERGWYAPGLFRQEFRLLSELGLCPKLDRCSVCDQPFRPGHRARFSAEKGGMLCDDCEHHPDAHSVTADVLAILNHWQRDENCNIVRAARCSPRQLTSIRLLLGDFLSYHLDLRPSHRDTALNMVMTDSPQR